MEILNKIAKFEIWYQVPIYYEFWDASSMFYLLNGIILREPPAFARWLFG